MSKHLHTSRCAHVHLPLSRAPVSPLTIILSLSQVPLSPCRRPPCHFHGRLCHPVTVSLSLSRVPLSPCDCLSVTVVSSSVTPHRLPVSVAGVSVTLSLSQGVSVAPHRHTAFVAGASVFPHRLPVTVAGVSVTLSPCHCLPIAFVSSSVTPHRHIVSVAGVSVTLKLSRGVSVAPHPHTVSVAGVSVTLLLSQASLSPRHRLPLSLSRAPLSHHHHHPVSIVSVSVTPSPSSRLCHGCLCYHVSVILSLLRVSLSPYHSLPSISRAPLSPRHRDLVSIAGASITPSPSPCLYRRSICEPATNAVFVTVSLSPLSLSSCHNHDVSGTMLLSSYHC